MNINSNLPLQNDLLFVTYDHLSYNDLVSFSVTCRQAIQLLPTYMPRREKRILEETMNNWQNSTVDKTKFIAELLRNVDFVTCSTIGIEKTLTVINPSSIEFVEAFFGWKPSVQESRRWLTLNNLDESWKEFKTGLNLQNYMKFLNTKISEWVRKNPSWQEYPRPVLSMPGMETSAKIPNKRIIFKVLWEANFELEANNQCYWPSFTSEEDAKIIVEVANAKNFSSITLRQQYHNHISISKKAIEVLKTFNKEVNLIGADLDLSKLTKTLTIGFGILLGLGLLTCWIALPILFGHFDHGDYVFCYAIGGALGTWALVGISGAPYGIAWLIKQRSKGNMHFVPPPIIPPQEQVPTVTDSSMETVD